MNPEVAEKLGLLLRNKSEQTKKAYLICIEKFLQFAGLKDSYDEWDIRRFAEKINYLSSFIFNCSAFVLTLSGMALEFVSLCKNSET